MENRTNTDDATRDATRAIAAVVVAIEAQTIDAADADLMQAIQRLLNAIDARLIADDPGCALLALARRQDAATASFRRALPAFTPAADTLEAVPPSEPLIGDFEAFVAQILHRRN